MSAATATLETPAASSTVLHQVVHTNDLEGAFRILQDALGIKSGDVAGQFFSRHELQNEKWVKLSPHARADIVSAYLAIEAMYSQ